MTSAPPSSAATGDKVNPTSATSSETEEVDHDEDDDEVTLSTMLSEQVLTFPVIEPLPPTPVKQQKPMKKAVAPPLSSPTSSPGKLRVGKKRTVKTFGNKKKSKLRDVLGDDEQDEEINLPHKKPAEKLPPGEGSAFISGLLEDVLESAQENKDGSGGSRKCEKLKKTPPLEFPADGRGNVLLADVETVKKTKEKVDSLITLLEKTKEKLVILLGLGRDVLHLNNACIDS